MAIRDFIKRARGGLSPTSQIARRLGSTRTPRFAGVAISAPDETSAWGVAHEIASGEYALPGLTPKQGDSVVDIGANVGLYALWAARRGARVVAYEPSPETVVHLRRNTRRVNVHVVQAAVVGADNEQGTTRLFIHEERTTRNTVLGREIGTGTDLSRYVDVPALTIDRVLASPCSLLKVDCEGAEFEIFERVSDEALRHAEKIVLEFHRLAGDPIDLLARLGTAGFRAEIASGSDVDSPFGIIGAFRIGAQSPEERKGFT